jgi:hypothetical protein
MKTGFSHIYEEYAPEYFYTLLELNERDSWIQQDSAVIRP